MECRYPNLELLEYKVKSFLNSDSEAKKKLNIKQITKKTRLEFDTYVFPQTWGSTALGFDVNEKGEAMFAGQAFTKAYTTVIYEYVTDIYFVFFDGRFCYCIENANEKFLSDLKNCDLASRSEAMKLY